MSAITGPLSTAPNAGNPYIGRGKLYIDRFDASGNRTGQRDIGNVTVFQVENKVTVKEVYESMDPASSLYARGVTQQVVTIKITGDEYTLENLAAAINASLDTVTGAGATIAAEAITPTGGAVLGRYYDLANRNVTTLTDVKQASTSLVLGTDYTADLVKGRIYLLPTSSTITPGSQLTADYIYGAFTYNSIDIASVSTVECYVRFIGNPIKGHTFEHEYWHVSFAPTGTLDWIADDFGNWQLEGEVIADLTNHPTSPLGRIIQTA